MSLSLDQVPVGERRGTRALLQLQLADELAEAILQCAASDLSMPLAALLRSLIDTAVLGIWLATYATDKQAGESIAAMSTETVVKDDFKGADRDAFAFLNEPVQGTDHRFYRDILHPSIHGDATHLAMRIRDAKAKKQWVTRCVAMGYHVYRHLVLQIGKSGIVPQSLRTHIDSEIERMNLV